MALCIICKNNPVYVKKRQLCISCYQREYRNSRINVSNPRFIKASAEIIFSTTFFNHKNWIYQPALFRFDSQKYTPDFYDGKRGVFIEVAGSRQAYHANKSKYAAFKKAYPSIVLEVRLENGSLLSPESDKSKRLGWANGKN